MVLLLLAILASAIIGLKAIYIIITGGICGYIYKTFVAKENEECAKGDE